MSRNEKVVLGAAAAAGAIGLYYLLAGAGRANNAALIPDAIEDRIDAVVDALDERYGKAWAQLGLGALQAGLRKVLPAPLVALVDAVYAAEQYGRRHGWTGPQKRAHATRAA